MTKIPANPNRLCPSGTNPQHYSAFAKASRFWSGPGGSRFCPGSAQGVSLRLGAVPTPHLFAYAANSGLISWHRNPSIRCDRTPFVSEFADSMRSSPLLRPNSCHRCHTARCKSADPMGNDRALPANRKPRATAAAQLGSDDNAGWFRSDHAVTNEQSSPRARSAVSNRPRPRGPISLACRTRNVLRPRRRTVPRNAIALR